jgi:hypothetical protein
MDSSVGHGGYFLAKNVAAQETEYVCWKAHGIYLEMFLSDGVRYICTVRYYSEQTCEVLTLLHWQSYSEMEVCKLEQYCIWKW